MTIEQTLQRLKAAGVRMVSVGDLRTDDALQPRESRMVPLKKQHSVQTRSEEHTGTMLLALRAAAEVQLEPLLVAEIDGGLYVVDGHHRLKAYQRAPRETAPVRAVSMDRRRAVLVSKLVNCDARALEMQPEQKRDAAWQYMAAVTRQGVDGLPAGESLRRISARFGISKDTVAAMLRKLPKVNPKAIPAEMRDPGTGFPRWKAVCDWRPNNEDELMSEPMSLEQWTKREAVKIARKLGAVESSTTPAAWKLALAMYASEAKAEAQNPDTLDFLREIADYSGPVELPVAEF